MRRKSPSAWLPSPIRSSRPTPQACLPPFHPCCCCLLRAPCRVGVASALMPHSLKSLSMDERQLAVAGESGLLALWSLADIQQALEARGRPRQTACWPTACAWSCRMRGSKLGPAAK